jgi:hypothetical protein
MPEHIRPISLGLMDGLRSSDEDARGEDASMVLVPLFNLKFLTEFAAGDVGTSIGGTSPWHRGGSSV